MKIANIFVPSGYALLMVLASCTATAEDAQISSLQTGTKAIPIKRSAPRYPGNHLSSGRQGWVELSYVVTTDGAVVDPIVQDSSGSPQFERAALDVVKDWSFEPATWNGELVQQCDNKVLIAFAIEDAGKLVSPKFSRTYKAISKELNAGNLDEAEERINKAFKSKNLTLPEVSWLWALEAHRTGLAGDKRAQLRAVRKATVANGRWVSDELYPSLLLVQTISALETGSYSAALRSHEKLIEMDVDHPHLKSVQPNIDRLQSVIASNDIFSVSGHISGDRSCADCTNKWSHSLLRHRFSIANVSGDLDNLEIRCSRKRVVDQARPDISWDVPESWGSCSVIVFGEPGATFQLLEQPSDHG